MKRLAILLLAANLGLFFWGAWNDRVAEERQVDFYRPIGDLKLLSQVPPPPPKPAVEEGAAETAPVEDKPVCEPSISEDGLLNVILSPEPEPEPVAAEPEPEPVSLPPPPSSPAKAEMQWLDRPPSPQAPARVSVTRPAAAPPAPTPRPAPAAALRPNPVIPPGSNVCAVLGPIPERSEVVRIVGALMSRGINASLRELGGKSATTTGTTVYQVMIPPRKSAAETQAMLAKLKAAGFTDAFLVAGGPISLGVYSSRESAAKVRDRIVAKGFPAEVGEKGGSGVARPSMASGFLLEFPMIEEGSAKQAVLAELRTQFPDVPMMRNVCGASY